MHTSRASNAEGGDQFGRSVAISGSTIAVGVRDEDSNQTTITNNDGQPGHPDNNSATDAGAVYVFKRDANGDWIQDAYLKASNAQANDRFGWSVAISGSTIVVGANQEDSNQTTITNDDGTASTDNSATEAGAVYVFKRDGNGDWIQDAYLKASNAEANDYFGSSVAISGSTIVVGAIDEDSSQTTITNTDGQPGLPDNNSASGAGAVYVFKRDGNGDWIQDAYLKASNAGVIDGFGHSVAISGSTIVVGAYLEDSTQTTITNNDGQPGLPDNNSASNSGAVYVFKRDGNGDWIQDAYLKASNAEANDNFGTSVAIFGSTIAVGAYFEDSNQTTITNNDGQPGLPDNNSASNSGAVYVFKRDANGDWIQDAYLKASNVGLNDNFGYSVAISGSTIVVGAYYEDSNQTTITNTDGSASSNNSAADSGAVYVFKLQ
jgi:ketosteroid isomerase-like protein